MSQGCQGSSGKFQGRFKNVSTLFQQRLIGVSSIAKGIWKTCKKCVKEDIMLFQGCFKEISFRVIQQHRISWAINHGVFRSAQRHGFSNSSFGNSAVVAQYRVTSVILWNPHNPLLFYQNWNCLLWNQRMCVMS